MGEDKVLLRLYIEQQIKEKYGTQAALAKKLNQTQGNISKKLSNPSSKFIRTLATEAGIVVPERLLGSSPVGQDIERVYEKETDHIRPPHPFHIDPDRIDKLFLEIGKVLARMEYLEREMKQLKEQK